MKIAAASTIVSASFTISILISIIVKVQGACSGYCVHAISIAIAIAIIDVFRVAVGRPFLPLVSFYI